MQVQTSKYNNRYHPLIIRSLHAKLKQAIHYFQIILFNHRYSQLDHWKIVPKILIHTKILNKSQVEVFRIFYLEIPISIHPFYFSNTISLTNSLVWSIPFNTETFFTMLREGSTEQGTQFRFDIGVYHFPRFRIEADRDVRLASKDLSVGNSLASVLCLRIGILRDIIGAVFVEGVRRGFPSTEKASRYALAVNERLSRHKKHDPCYSSLLLPLLLTVRSFIVRSAFRSIPVFKTFSSPLK